MSTGAGEHVAPSLPRSPSKESLSTHPLVPAATDGQHTAPQVLGNSATSSPPRYAPYVSRQSRAAQSTQLSVASVPASRALSPQDSAAHPSAATSKLQHQHLKAAAQRIGLNAPSYGWTLLETIVHDGELEEVWDALTVGKATLLLPAEENTPTDKIPVEEIKNHIAFLDHAAISSTPLVTLSGLKGVCYGYGISFLFNYSVLTGLHLVQFSHSIHPSLLRQRPSRTSNPPLPGVQFSQYSPSLPSSMLIDVLSRRSHSIQTPPSCLFLRVL
jgi:hypothetical protein